MERPQIQHRNFPHTASAFATWEAGQPARDAAWAAVDSESDVWNCERADQQAWLVVQDAFWQDTKDINSLSGCRAVGPDYIRVLVRVPK